MAQLRMACLVGPDFEDSEFRVPYDRFVAAGVAVDVVGAAAGEELVGYHGRETVTTDRGIDQIRPEDYGALFIPGGYSPDHLRADRRFVDFVKAFDGIGHVIAAVCHGPQLLISAGLVRGRTLTAWKTVQDDLRQIGASVKDEPVVQDRNWITSRQPADLPLFSDAVLRMLGVDHRAARAAQSAAQAVQPPAQPAAAPAARPPGQPPIPPLPPPGRPPAARPSGDQGGQPPRGKM